MEGLIIALGEDARVHLSPTPLKELRSSHAELDVTYKPRGLWYGIGTAWYAWCRSEMPHWVGLEDGHGSDRGYEFIYRVEVDESRILSMSEPAELLEFTAEYHVPDKESAYWRYGRMDTRHIDWRRVAEDYGGIEISPYQYELRMDERTAWYYPWDCASGCVWDKYCASVELADDYLDRLYP